MKMRGEIFYLTVLLVAGLIITPALGSTHQAELEIKSQTRNPETITLDFIDCTSTTIVKKEVMMTRTEWQTLTNELHSISKTGVSTKDIFTAQLKVFQNHGLVSEETSADVLLSKFNQRKISEKNTFLQKRMHTSPLNNTLFSVLSAITYTLENGTNIVFGLNTFINLIGFNIISVHKGYAPAGIQTNGVMTASVPSGEYIGSMFGFFGYWYGTKVSTATYSNLTVAGLTFITLWLPIQSP